MKRPKQVMELDAKEKYFSSPPIIDQKMKVVGDSEAEEKGIKEGPTEFNKLQPLTEAEAEEVFNKLKGELEKSEPTKRTRSKKKWRTEELQLLKWAIKSISEARGLAETQFGLVDWEDVATLVPGRTGSQCRYRWLAEQDHQLKKMPWSEKEDKILKELVFKGDKKPWAVIAQELNSISKTVERTGKQCRERWRNHLDPEIKKYYSILHKKTIRDPWKDAEDVVLLKGYLEHKNKWSEITRLLSGRSENSVKNRFNILLKRYKQEAAAEKVTELGKALQALAMPGKDNLEWVRKLIAEKESLPKEGEESKKKYEEKELENVVKATSQISLEDPKSIHKIMVSLMEESVKDVFVNPGDYSCPNNRYIDRVRQREVDIMQQSTRFINPETLQEIYLTPTDVFISDGKARNFVCSDS